MTGGQTTQRFAFTFCEVAEAASRQSRPHHGNTKEQEEGEAHTWHLWPETSWQSVERIPSQQVDLLGVQGIFN